MSDTDRTDIIGGLRATDTLTTRTRRDVPKWAWATVGGVALTGVALISWSLAAAPQKPPTAVTSPSASGGSAEAVPLLPLPSTTDASPRLRTTHTAPRPSPTRKATSSPSPRVTSSPTPTPTRTVSSAPTPTRTHESPSPAPTDSDAPPTLTPPTITPEATPHGQ